TFIGDAPILEHIAEVHAHHVRSIFLERGLRRSQDFLGIAVLELRRWCRRLADRRRDGYGRSDGRRCRRSGATADIYRNGKRDRPNRGTILSNRRWRFAFRRRCRWRRYNGRGYQRRNILAAHEHCIEQLTLCRARYLITERLYYAANAHAFIGDPLDPIFA